MTTTISETMRLGIAVAEDGGDGAVTVSEFVRRHGLELQRFAYLICGDRHRAEDLLQDVLLAMYRRFGEDIPLHTPVAYARRAIVNANVTRLRRASSGEVAVAAVDDRPAPDHADAGDIAERDALWQALRRLPERQRSALVMRYYLDAPDHDIASALDCRRGTVRSLLSRGLEALRHDTTLVQGELS